MNMTETHLAHRRRSRSPRRRHRDSPPRGRLGARRGGTFMARSRSRSRSVSPELSRRWDSGEASSRNSRSRRSQSPLPRRTTFPQIAGAPEPQSTSAVGRRSASPRVTQRNSTHALQSPILPIKPLPKTDGTNSETDGMHLAFETFAKGISDTGLWYSERYRAIKKIQNLNKTLRGFPKGESEYGSQYELCKAQIKDYQAQKEATSGRYLRATKHTQEMFMNLLARPEVKAALLLETSTSTPQAATAPNGMSKVQDNALENRIASLENSYKTEIQSQNQRIAVLERKVDVSSQKDNGRRKRIDELEKSIAKLSKELEGANTQITQLKADSMKLEATSKQPACIADAPEITDLQALNKDLSRRLRDCEIDYGRMSKQLLEGKSGRHQAPGTHKAFAMKDELHAFVKKEDIENLASKDDLKLFAAQHDLEKFATKHELQAFTTKEDLIMFATKDDVNACAMKEDIKAFVTKLNIEKLSTAFEKRSSVIGQSLESLQHFCHGVSHDAKNTKALVNDLLNLRTRVLALESTVVKKEDLKAFVMKLDIEELATAYDKRLSGIDKSLENLRHFNQDVADEAKNAKVLVNDLLNLRPRVLALESTVIKREEFHGINPEQLRALTLRDFATDIVQEVAKQVAVLAPVPTKSGNTVEVVVAEVQRRLQEELNRMSTAIGTFIDQERAEREGLCNRLRNTIADLTALAARLTIIENRTPTSPAGDLEKTRADCVALIGQVSTSTHQAQATLTERTTSLTTDVQRISNSLNSLHGQLSSLHHHTEEQYKQLFHQHHSLHTWQQQFTAKNIYRDIVVKTQELVPNGTLARVQNLELRMENVERNSHVGASQQMNVAQQLNGPMSR